MNIVRYWIERRRLRREIRTLGRGGEMEEAEREERPNRLAGPVLSYESLEYERLLEQAHRLGVNYERDRRIDAG